MSTETAEPDFEAPRDVDGGDLRASLASLLERLGPQGDAGEIARAIDAVFAELRLAQEEVRAQNEELAEAQRLLDAERARYEELAELSPVGYLVTNRTGTILEANRAAHELLAVKPPLLVGKPLAVYVSAGDRRAFGRALAAVGHGGDLPDRELRLVRRNGVEVTVSVRARPMLVDGVAAGARWAIAERSDAKHAAGEGPLRVTALVQEAETRAPREELLAAFRAERNRLSMLLQRLHYGVATVDSALSVRYANAAAQSLLELRSPRGAPLPDPWREFSLRGFASQLLTADAEPLEHTVVAAKRAYRVVGLPAGATDEAILVIEDISESERRERAERDFVTNAAHQLRTPVSAIASAVEVLQAGAKDVTETRDRFLAHIDRQCERLVRLTRALLVLARAQALDEPPSLEIVRLRPVLAHIAAGLHPGEGVEVEVDCAAHVAALTNRDLVEQAIGNLAENAAKFTVSGRIVLSGVAVDAGSVEVSVRDTGPGVAFDESRTFERFFRDEDSGVDGFGLGLAIVQEAARVLDGTLRLESSAEGTTAVLTLPAARLRALER